MSRLRTRTATSGPGGFAKDLTGVLGDITYPPLVTWTEQCIDVSDSPGVDHPFEKVTVQELLGSCTGQNGFAYIDEHIQYKRETFIFAPPLTTRPSDNASMTHALATTAPFVPSWNGSSALLQLKDLRHLPRQVRDIGDAILTKRKPKSLLKAGANWNLLLMFGISPVIGDLRKLLDFQARADKRALDFESMRSPNGASKTAGTWSDTSETLSLGNFYPADHYAASALYECFYTTYRKSWGSVRWSIPTRNLPPSGSGQEKYLANRLANGIDITPDTLWDLMPWTWLIDWFSNIDDFIKLSYNIVGATSGRYCLMDHTVSKFTAIHRGGPDIFTVDPNCYGELKKRTPLPFVYPEVHLPFFTGQMSSILGSLYIQRFL